MSFVLSVVILLQFSSLNLCFLCILLLFGLLRRRCERFFLCLSRYPLPRCALVVLPCIKKRDCVNVFAFDTISFNAFCVDCNYLRYLTMPRGELRMNSMM